MNRKIDGTFFEFHHHNTAEFERVKKQIENVAPYVDKILGYQCLGLMNPADSKAFAGHESSVELYEKYKNYISNK